MLAPLMAREAYWGAGHTRYTHFQFSILQLLPKAVTPDEVIQTETLWKKKLLTYEPFGMNQN